MNSKQNNKIIFFIGPSGSGKDTFLARVLNEYQINPIVLLTTRPMRDGEQNGVEYNFVTSERMNLLEQKNMLIERRDYNTQHGIWSYATSKGNINLSLHNYITSNTWVGYNKFLSHYNRDELVPLYFNEEMLSYYKPFIIDNNGTFEETVEQIDDILVRKLEILHK